jgi:hydrogenase-4 component E
MIQITNALLMLILVLNLFTLGSSRISSLIRIVAIQGVILGVIPLLMHGHITLAAIGAAVAAIALKGIVIPGIITKALRDAQIKREVEPLIGFLPSIIIGAIATAASLLFFNKIPLAGQEEGLLIIPTAVATIFAGFILLTTRFKAITQTLGYLILENGIFIFSMLLIEAIPLVIEMGMLLDLFVGIFVISIITNHINRAFASLDTRKLANLKED